MLDSLSLTIFLMILRGVKQSPEKDVSAVSGLNMMVIGSLLSPLNSLCTVAYVSLSKIN